VGLEGAHRLAAESWNHLATRGFHLHQWCAAAERFGWNPRHVAVHGATRIKAIIPAYVTGSGNPYDLHQRWLGRLAALATRAGLELRPVLSVQAPFSSVSEPLGGLTPLSSATMHEIFYALEQAAEREEAKAVVWPFLDTTQHRIQDIARDRGYAVLYGGLTALMPVRWSSFDEYLASRSRTLRRSIQGDLDAIRASGLRSTLGSDFEPDASRMDRLCRDAWRMYNGRQSPISPHLFQYLGRHPTPAIRAHLTWRGDHLVGTSLNLATPELLDRSFAAYPPEYVSGPVFHNDMVYEPIRIATREGIGVIDLGPGAFYTKVLHGAVLQRRIILLKGTTARRHRLLNLLGQLIARRTNHLERKSLGSLWGPRCFGDDGR
jgi:predicted N-acyltransferase